VTIRVGTSGWHYAHWKGPFYPARMSPRDYLGFYSQHFDSVEIDGSFYRLPKPPTLKEWYRTVPKGFLFAMKASRYLTHMKKLKDAREPLHRFLRVAERLKDKLGPLLLQFPPWWRLNLDRLESFLPLLPKSHRFTMEFRDPTWFDPKTLDLLNRYGVAFCIYEIAGKRSPSHLTTNWTYIRLHGAAKAYSGNYPLATLKKWAKSIADWKQEGKDTYIYFDNDQAGYAAKNAATLKELFK
jgi:uncharacterized protein YecE (DUF72 family)